MAWTLVGAAMCAMLLSQRGMGWLLIYIVPGISRGVVCRRGMATIDCTTRYVLWNL